MIQPPRRRAIRALVLLPLAAACGAPAAGTPPPVAPAEAEAAADRTAVATAPAPLLPPRAARLLGLLPRRAVGAEQFVLDRPTADGRGVLIAILDSGIDAGVPGLQMTTTDAPKLLDLRDFSGEGRVDLRSLAPDGDAVIVGGVRLRGFGRVRGLAAGRAWGGTLLERRLGSLPAADLNGDGDRADTLAVVVARGPGGWFVLADADGDGTLADEDPVRDFLTAGETLAWGPVTVAVNLTAADDVPQLDLYFDTSGHGTHVAGIAAGHDMFGVEGFDGIAPGASLLGLKIANDARGGISVTGSMVRAMDYAADVAARRGMPLVVNLSFGIGNQDGPRRPLIDSVIDAYALAHPDVVFVISAGNDGPGISTVGFPGSAAFALSACALFPGAFAQSPSASTAPAADVLGWWSARGGVFQKPDVCVPGVAFSNVPPWQTGEEVSGGTSMAAPQLAGIAALLQSAVLEGGPPASAAAIAAAIRNTATPIGGATTLDQGTGVPNVETAFRWLRAGHRAGRFAVQTAPDGGNRGLDAAYRRNGLAPGDTLQRFVVQSAAGQPFAKVLLRPDVPWLSAPRDAQFAGAPVSIPVRYDTEALAAPGLYVGTVWARPATDTLGGAAFGLTSTIVVPYELTTPLEVRRYVPKGRTARLFVAVPDDAGGLSVRARVPDEEQSVSLYLFEPTGQPQRDEPSVELGGQMPAAAELLVRAEDVVPGVYEVVLVAPPTRSVTVDVTASLVPVHLSTRGSDGVRLANPRAQPVEGSASIRPVGAGREFRMRGGSRVAARQRFAVPAWAGRVQVDVAFPTELWRRITDVGATLWDADGYLVHENPLNYPASRYVVTLPAGSLPALEFELMPAFALPEDDGAWEAVVRVAFLPDIPLAGPTTIPFRLGPESEMLLGWTSQSLGWMPPDLQVLTEITAVTAGAPAAVLRTMIAPVTETR